jgi:hypothetical protein
VRKTKTISIPPALEAEMAKFEENWSAVACRAFEIRIQELKAMNIKDEDKKAVARLRASKSKATDALYAKGERDGTKYALLKAEFMELERLDKYVEGMGNASTEESLYSLSKVLAGDEGYDDDIRKNLQEYYGDDTQHESWVDGFIDGALKKYADISAEM